MTCLFSCVYHFDLENRLKIDKKVKWIQGGLGAGGTQQEACLGGVLEVPSGLMGTIYTQFDSGFMENPYSEKLIG